MPTLILVGLVVSIVSGLGSPLIPTIARTDHVSFSSAQWVLTAALLSGAASTAVLGRLADGARQRAVMVFMLAVAAAGCVLAAASNDFLLLVVGRGLQGLGLGLLPVNMAVARRNLTHEQASRTIATLSVTTAVGAGLGYPVTGFIVETLNFHAAYWFGAIMLFAALVSVVAVLPARTAASPDQGRFDLVGAITLVLGVVGVVVLSSEGGSWGWTSARSLVIAAASLLLLAAWVLQELRISHPLVDLRNLKRRAVLTADVAGFLMSAAMYLVVPILVVFIQVPRAAGFGFGASVVMAGFVMIPLSIASYGASRLIVPFERRFGMRTMIPVGALVTAAASLLFAFEHSALWEAFAVMGIIGLGVGFTFAAMPGLIVRSVPRSETGSATGLYQVLRNIGLSIGSASSAAVLHAYTRDGHSIPAAGGFEAALCIAAALSVATAVLSFLLPGERASTARARLSTTERAELELMMEEEAEIAGMGLMSGNDQETFAPSSERPCS
jgi:MFS family permease